MHVLDPCTMPLAGRSLIEASAGTGKTWTLTLLVVRLIVEQDLGIEQILVLTYTRAATAELRGRIRLRLREAQKQLAGQAQEDDPALVQVLAAVEPEIASLRLDQALARMDEAAITTIHGFCQKVIKEHAFEAGFSFDQDIITDEAALRDEVMADFWRNHFYPLGPEESALVQAHWPGPENLLAAIANTLMVEDVCMLPRLAADALPRQLEALQLSHGALVQAWEQHGESARIQLENDPCLSRSKDNYREDQVEELLIDLAELLLNPVFPRLLPSRLERLSTGYMLNRLFKKKACTGWQPAPFFNVFDQLWQDYQGMLRLWKITWLHAARLYLKEELQRRKQAQRLLGYDDLLSQLDLALQNPDSGPQLARAIRHRYQAVLVDEFQDTDPVQYRIFSAICSESRYPFHMIGDPKQAIYSFRGGDIFTYMQAKGETLPEQRYTMGTNHRSAPGMIAVSNTLFSRRQDAFVFTDIPFHQVQASGRVQNMDFTLQGVAPVPLHVLLLSSEDDQVYAKEKADGLAATASATAIKQLLQLAAQGEARIGDRPLASRDIAVLVRTHSQAELMRSSLLNLGLNSVYASRLSVFSSPEAAELELVLRAVLNPANHALCTAALATGLFGLNALALYQLKQDALLWGEQIQRLRSYQRHWQRQGITAMLHRIFHKERITIRLTAQPGGERKLTNFLHLAELLHEEERQRPGMERLLRWLLRQRQQADGDGEDNRLMRQESDQELIQISTQHSAKGLEYPVVFLPFLWRAQSAVPWQDTAIAFHDRNTLNACRDFDTDNEEHRALSAEEALAEEMRLLYVALTRARYCTCICWGRVNGLMDTPMARLLHIQDVKGDEDLLRRDLDQLNETAAGLLVRSYPPGDLPWTGTATGKADPVTTPPLVARSFQGSVPQGYITCSYTSLSSGQELNPVIEENVDSLLNPALFSRIRPEDFQRIATFPRGTRAGLCLHALLEELDFTLPVAVQQEHVQKQLEQYGFDLRWQTAVQVWLANVLATPLPGSRSLAGLTPENQLRELTFLFPVQKLAIVKINQLFKRFDLPNLPGRSEVLKGLMKGFVDLIFRHKGCYYIVDYKSNHLGDEPGSYTPQALATSMAQHHYHLQYLLYTLALHRYLQTRLQGYNYERHFGGVYYLFLRGMEPGQAGQGIYRARPALELIQGLDALCRGVEAGDAAA